MKKIFVLLTLLLFNFKTSFAIELKAALSSAYKNNTELNAERENIVVSIEDLKISKSDYLPSATITGTKSQEDTNKLTNQSGGDATITDVDPLTKSIKLEQTILDLGRGAEYRKKKIGLALSETKLIKKEQEILYKAIEAFTNLILSNEKLNINLRNLNLLERQVESDRIRLERGDITLSDLSQSESSYAGAQAQFIQAQNEVVTNRLNYENIIGKINDPSSLKKSLKAFVDIPSSLSEAIELSRKNNPDIKIAKFELEQAEKDIDIAKSDLSPTATLSLERTYTDDLSSTYDEREKDILKATVTWPFFAGGKNIAKLKKNKSLKTKKRLLLDNVTKANNTNVASSWSNLQSSESLLASVRAQVQAAEIANEGINAEYERGSRTTLDVIQSSTFLLNAQILLANSERNYLLAQYSLLKSIGLLNNNYLKIQ
tara:strand:+ start:1129 stop:2421 length:1293 start_codon:yes stop_codon:yes gene_type:complete